MPERSNVRDRETIDRSSKEKERQRKRNRNRKRNEMTVKKTRTTKKEEKCALSVQGTECIADDLMTRQCEHWQRANDADDCNKSPAVVVVVASI